VRADDFAAAQAHPIHTRPGVGYASAREQFVRWGDCFAALARDRRVVIVNPMDADERIDCARLPALAAAPGAPDVAALVDNVGIAGDRAGPRVYLVDRYGLTDPIVARFRLPARGRPGHEKHLPGTRAWAIARFAAAGDQPLPRGVTADGVAAARAALACAPLAELLDAVGAPLTARRFFRNLWRAPRLTRLRFASLPYQARPELCGD
jgi:hypothetical protein